MIKKEIEMKREYLIVNVSEQINQIRNILYNFGDIPEIADDIDANILLNNMLMKKDQLKALLAAFKCQPDIVIEGFDDEVYLNDAQDKIFFYISEYNRYAFNASVRHRDYEFKMMPEPIKKIINLKLQRNKFIYNNSRNII